MALRPVPRNGESPAARALQAQQDAAHAAQAVADEILADYSALVHRAGEAFELTAVAPNTREILRDIHRQGVLNLKRIG